MGEVPTLFGWLPGVLTQTGDLSENTGASVRPPRLRVGMRAVPRLCIELCPGIYLTTEENHGKTSVTAGKLPGQPSQAKVLTGGGDLREAQVDVPRLLAIPAFDRVAGLNNRHLNYNRGICLR